MKNPGLSRQISAALLLAALLAWCLGPLLWQLATSLKTNAEITTLPVQYLPKEPTGEHYASLFGRRPFLQYLWNSFFISSGATLLCLLVGSMAAYAFARLRPKGGKWILVLLVAISFFPAITFFFPLYELVRKLGLANHPLALILPYAAFNLPLAVLFLTVFFRTIPAGLEEAGLIDGLSRWQVLWRLMLPLSAPGLATTAILIFIACWNEFLFALAFMPRDEAKTVTVAIATLSGGSLYEIPWGPLGAAIIVSVAPLLVLVAFFQRRIVQGLTQGSMAN